MQQTAIAVGLAALVSGCDDNKVTEIGRCKVGNVEVKAMYHQVYAPDNFMELEFYVDNKLMGTVIPDTNIDRKSTIYCDGDFNMYVFQNTVK